jgi:hypothetical protein
MNRKSPQSKARQTSRLNKDRRWIFENNRGLLFIYNVNNRRVQVRNRNVVYKNNGKRIVQVGRTRDAPAKSGKYRVPRGRRKYPF